MAISRNGSLSPENCRQAVAKWLETKVGLSARSSRLFDADGRLWLEFSDLAVIDELDNSPPIPYLRGILHPRVVDDLNAAFLSNNTIVLTLYSRDPTPLVTTSNGVVQTDRPASGMTVALTEVRDQVIARDVTASPSAWGTNIAWPFED